VSYFNLPARASDAGPDSGYLDCADERAEFNGYEEEN
jgi:hypothetical protein